jgi:predicted phage terminase large subunit-like protein
MIGRYPDLHVNIVTKTASLAEEILTALITRIEVDDRYRNIFGKLKPADPKKWTGKELIVVRGEISKNPTLKATGLMGPITGGRSDLIICDDIIDEENIRTPLQLEKVNTWFNKVLYPTLYPWGGIIVIGTRWSYADIYAELLSKWPHDVKQAIQQDGTALWSDYWTLTKLEERRKEIGSIFFNCQYQNDPTTMQGDLLKAEWLHPWTELDNTGSWNPASHLPNYAAVDPSLGEGDYFGIATLAWDQLRGLGYLKDVWAQHKPFPEILKQVLPQLNATYHYQKIYMETNFWQKILTMVQEMRNLPIVPIQTVKNKEQRFIPMSSHFEAKRVYVNPLLLGPTSEFWTEWVQFPRGAHDDALDCVEMVVSNVVAKGTGNIAFLFK